VKIKSIHEKYGFFRTSTFHVTFQIGIVFFADKLRHLIKDLKCQ